MAASPDLYTGDEYSERHPRWHREHSAWKAAQVLTILERNKIKPATIAEVGCGAGAILATLQGKLPPTVRLTGYDIAPAALRLAEPLQNERLQFVLGDFLGLAAPQYDLLMALDVVEHVEDYLGFLRAMRPRAAVHVFHFPLDLSLLSLLQPVRLHWARSSVGHLHYFTAETVIAALENAGYTVTDCIFTAVELDTPPPTGQRQRLRVLRRIGFRLSPTWTSRILGGCSLLVLCR